MLRTSGRRRRLPAFPPPCRRTANAVASARQYAIFNYRKKKQKTKVHWKTLNPTWNESITFEVASLLEVLYVTVKDRDIGSPDDPMGHVAVPLNKLYDDEPWDIWLPLEDVDHGEIHLILTLSNSGRRRAKQLQAPVDPSKQTFTRKQLDFLLAKAWEAGQTQGGTISKHFVDGLVAELSGAPPSPAAAPAPKSDAKLKQDVTESQVIELIRGCSSLARGAPNNQKTMLKLDGRVSMLEDSTADVERYVTDKRLAQAIFTQIMAVLRKATKFVRDMGLQKPSKDTARSMTTVFESLESELDICYSYAERAVLDAQARAPPAAAKPAVPAAPGVPAAPAAPAAPPPPSQISAADLEKFSKRYANPAQAAVQVDDSEAQAKKEEWTREAAEIMGRIADIMVMEGDDSAAAKVLSDAEAMAPGAAAAGVAAGAPVAAAKPAAAPAAKPKTQSRLPGAEGKMRLGGPAPPAPAAPRGVRGAAASPAGGLPPPPAAAAAAPPPADSGKVCKACRLPIHGSFVNVTQLQAVYHEGHFTCKICGIDLAGQNFVPHNDEPYCEKDWQEHCASRCGSCAQPIANEFVEAGGTKFHPPCFVCSTCKAPLTGAFYTTPDGKVLCEAHLPTSQVSDQTCGLCGQPVANEVYEAMDKVFHPECFKCAKCSGALTSVFVTVDGKFLHEDCA